ARDALGAACSTVAPSVKLAATLAERRVHSTLMNPVYPGLAAAAFYLIGAFTQINALARKTPVPRRRLLWITTPGVVSHAVTAYLVLWQPAGINLGILSVASLIGFTLVLFVYIGSLWQPLENLFVMVLPLGALTVATSTFSSGLIIPSS